MDYTYYGDLLGFSNYYQLNPDTAYEKLNDFYNTTFYSLSDYCQQAGESVHINMLSDTLMIWGNDIDAILPQLQELYLKLVDKGLLLRGAIVEGTLNIDPRVTLENFDKMLPINNTLAKAAALQSTQSGARLIIENTLVKHVLINYEEWMTIEGYLSDIKTNVEISHISRRISPTPDNITYELLYFWPIETTWNNNHVMENIVKKLKEQQTLYKREIAVHYTNTLALFRRSEQRRRFTERHFA